MIWDGTLYKPEVAWRTIITEAVMVSAATESVPAVYQVTVEPTDNTDPGANTAAKAVNHNILDYLGHIYRITEINIGGNSKRAKVSDDFRWGQSPINGKQAIVYKSIGGGFAPWLAATYGTHLASTAANTAAGIDNAILWHTRESISFTNIDTDSVRIKIPSQAQLDAGDTFQTLYANRFPDDCDLSLIIDNGDGTEWVNTAQCIRNIVDNKLISAYFDLSMGIISGRIIISR